MGIKKYIANKDNTITNAFRSNLTTRATGSNMGASDILETFSIYGQAYSSSSAGVARSQELSRVLIQFPTADIEADRTAGSIPASGSVEFYLKVFNAKHSYTVPKNLKLIVAPVSSSWEEGFGLDMEEYLDDTKDLEGSNWIRRSGANSWTTVGGTYLTASDGNNAGDLTKTVLLPEGTEDVELDITNIVEKWIKGFGDDGAGIENYGLGLRITGSQEAYYSSSAGSAVYADDSIIQNLNGAQRSYYTKKFFSRTSQFFFKKPCIEARWDSTTKDNRGNIQYSSSLLSGEDNLNTLYLYNYVNGRLKNIPGVTDPSNNIYVQLFSGSTNNTAPSASALELVTTTNYVNSAVPTVVTGGYVSTGIYSASFALTASSSPVKTVYDVWYLDGEDKLGTQINTSSFEPEIFYASQQNGNSDYVLNVNNLKPSYTTSEIPRIRTNVRLKNWNPTIYSKAVATVENITLDNIYYKINRTIDDFQVISYGTGSSTAPTAVGNAGSYTRLSSDVSGSYFDLDMSILEPGYMYSLTFCTFVEPGYKQFNSTFNFRVEESEDS
jgi:hypothetical protein